MVYEKAQEAASYILGKIGSAPKIGLVLGSGLGGLAEKISNPVFIDYAEIPNFVSSTAPGHKGRFVIGELNGTAVMCMQGRLHYYEGYPLWNVTFPVRVMKLLGVETLILTNAAGGINMNFKVGDFMILQDHINYTGVNPLIGKNEEGFGPRFCDMTFTYDRGLQRLAEEAAAEVGTEIHKGVYVGYSGPSFETPAEIRMFRILGGDAVGMSTVNEAIVASHCGMKLLAISCITNMAAGILEQKLDEQEVIAIGIMRAPVFQTLITRIVAKIAG